MATVIDFASRRALGATIRFEPATPVRGVVQEVRPASLAGWASGKVRISSNPQNRYDAAFKGHMSRRAQEMIDALRSSMSEYNRG